MIFSWEGFFRSFDPMVFRDVNAIFCAIWPNFLTQHNAYFNAMATFALRVCWRKNFQRIIQQSAWPGFAWKNALTHNLTHAWPLLQRACDANGSNDYEFAFSIDYLQIPTNWSRFVLGSEIIQGAELIPRWLDTGAELSGTDLTRFASWPIAERSDLYISVP